MLSVLNIGLLKRRTCWSRCSHSRHQAQPQNVYGSLQSSCWAIQWPYRQVAWALGTCALLVGLARPMAAVTLLSALFRLVGQHRSVVYCAVKDSLPNVRHRLYTSRNLFAGPVELSRSRLLNISHCCAVYRPVSKAAEHCLLISEW